LIFISDVSPVELGDNVTAYQARKISWAARDIDVVERDASLRSVKRIHTHV
jgi:hypothetical protein